MSTDILSDKERRLNAANQVRTLGDVALPRLQHWNYDACEMHAEVGPQIDCQYRKCGGDLFSHQRVGVAWLYAVQKGLLADDPGVGKTSQILALLCLLKQLKQLHRRAIIIPSTPAVRQWGEETDRWAPGLNKLVVDSGSDRATRLEKYSLNWDVLIIGYHLLIKDIDALERLGPFDMVVTDDVDALLSHSNETHRAIKRISKDATRAFTVNATTLQIRLQQLHAAFAPIGGSEPDMFGSLKRFETRHVRTGMVAQETQSGRIVRSRQKVGYKNIDELKQKIRPRYLRRKANELTDIRMPMVMPPEIVWLEMSPQQRAKYTELQQGILRLIRDEGESIKYLNALSQFTYGQQICAGLPALGEPDGPGASPKLDLLFHRLDDVWADRKSIVLVKNIGMVKAAIERTRSRDYDLALIWGQKQNPQQRQEQKEKFWDDPNCRFIVGTSSIIRSHNLQCSNNVVTLDSPVNPAAVWQFVGRAKRAGSPHDRVFVTQLFMQDTQESRYIDLLRSRQAVSDTIFDEESELFEPLPPLELLQLMTP